jgi:WD domain, G-beta repeat
VGPEKYRAPLVLCYLEGQTRDEAAARLVWSLRTLVRRLEQGRALLRGRLLRRGVTLGTALATSCLECGATSGAVPQTLVVSTTKAAVQIAAGRAAASVVSARVAALMKGGLHAMFTNKLKLMTTVLLLGGLMTTAVSRLVSGALFAPPEMPAAKRAKSQQRPAGQQPPTTAVLLDQRAAADSKQQAERPWIILDDGGDGELTAGELTAGADHRWKERATFRHGEPVISLALTKDLVAIGGDGDITVWDVQTAKMRYKSPDGYGHAGGVAWLACSVDGLWLFSGGITDGFQRTMDLTQPDLSKDCLRTGPLGRFDREPTAKVIAHGPDPKTWVQADGKAVQVTEWETPEIKVGKAADEQPRPQVVAGYEHDDTVRTAAFSHDGALLATGGDDKTVRLWTIATNKQRAILRGHTDAIAFVALAGAKHAASVSKDGRAILWDVAAEKQKALLTAERGIRCAAFSPGGRLLATGADDGTVKIWDVVEGRQIATLKGHQAAVRSLAFHPEGKMLASGSRDKTVKLWQLDD